MSCLGCGRHATCCYGRTAAVIPCQIAICSFTSIACGRIAHIVRNQVVRLVMAGSMIAHGCIVIKAATFYLCQITSWMSICWFWLKGV